MATYNRKVSRRGPVAFRRRNPVSATSQVENLARQLANQIIREREQAKARQRLGRIFTNFDPTDDVLPNNIETVTRGLFAGNTGSLTSMFTSSNLTATQKTYFQEIFSTGDPSSTSNANSELSVAYGHFAGSGSKDLTGNLNNDTPTRAIYKQYAQLLLAPNDKKFTINGVDTNEIYILNFNRSRVREKLDPGNFELSLAQLSGSAPSGIVSEHPNSAHTGSNVKLAGTNNFIQIIDDSSLSSGGSVSEGGLVYSLISGSIDEGTVIHNSSSPVYYGLLYPQHGVAILNGEQLNKDVSLGGVNFNSVTGSGVQGENAMKVFTSLSGSDLLTDVGTNGGIQARSSEQVKSTYYFVRVKNAEYNYSNNPSFVTGSLGELFFKTMIQDPQAYITTVGLYNGRRELLATAKLSQPLLKNYTREALIKVKLDF
jgi:hypothetical protein|tara:strand:- start:1409 stop:2692 length:1284 start_codon:yes stop_codon:yes gene_type:complete